jgi:hypothetical protein
MLTTLALAQGELPTDGLVGQWTFDNSSVLESATVGENLIPDTVNVTDDINGFIPVSGPVTGDGAVRVKLGSFYRCNHNIEANGFDPAHPDSIPQRVNRFSIVIDFHIPATGVWYSFHATDNDGVAKESDWDSFLNSRGQLGVGSTGYAYYKITDTEGWYRMVIVADLGVEYKYYLEGQLAQNGSPRSIDDRFSLDSPDGSNNVLFFGDNDGEDADIDVALLALYDRPLTLEEVSALGGYGHFIDYGKALSSWGFNDPENLTKAITGHDLTLNGSHSSVSGPSESDLASRIGVGSYYTATHGIPANGFNAGSTQVNRYTISMDVNIPALDAPYALIQTDPANSNDAELFINAEGKLGSSTLGWTDSAYVRSGEWYRVSMAVSLGDTLTNAVLYLDGKKILEKETLSAEGEYALSPKSEDNKVLFFADDNGEDNEISVAAISIYNRMMNSTELENLGGYEHNFSTENTPAVTTLDFKIDQNTQYVRIPYSQDFDIPIERSFTVEVWLKSGDGVEGDPSIVSNKDWGSGGNNGWNLAIKDKPWDLNLADTTRTRCDFDLENINDGKWHHIGFSLDRSHPGIVNDSIMVWTDNTFTVPLLFASGFSAGKELGPVINKDKFNLVFAQDGTEHYSDGYKFPGSIDEVRIWHAALDKETIQDWRHKDLTDEHPYFAQLEGYWKFNEGSGKTIADLSGKGHHGEVVGSPQWKISYAPMGDAEMVMMNNVNGIWAGESQSNSSNAGAGSDFSDLTGDKSFVAEMYALIGHNGENDATKADLSGNVQARMRRVWYYDASATFNKPIDFSFTLPTTAGEASGYVMLKRAEVSGTFEASAAVAVVNGTEVKFTGVQLTDGDYFTLGTLNATTSPLGYTTGLESGFGPFTYALKNNYPNPFNPVTTIEYSLAEKSDVTLMIYNVLGQEIVKLLDNENQPAGIHKIQWAANTFSSGIYYYRIKAGKFEKTQKMILIR